MMRKTKVLLTGLLAITLLFAIAIARPTDKSIEQTTVGQSAILDVETYINANKLLMFLTNQGGFANQATNLFGKVDGLYYPYTSIDDIESGANDNTVLFAAGLWLGGVNAANGDTLTAIAEFSNEFYPGPMSLSTYIPGADVDPMYKIYKLYRDSLDSNPNFDYLNWPTDQGAPLDASGKPLIRGDQTAWTVYNDANPAFKTNSTSGTAPMGIEVRQLVWAVDEDGDHEIPTAFVSEVTRTTNSSVNVRVAILDHVAVTGHDYSIVAEVNDALVTNWALRDITTGTPMQNGQIQLADTALIVVDGLVITITGAEASSLFSSFEIVANGNGPVDPPAPGALGFNGFPTPDRGNPGDGLDQQPGQWAFHTADNGGTCDGGDRGTYGAFISRTTRDGFNAENIGSYDYEMRFTGSYDNPGVGGSYAIEWYNDDNVFWVPFELWRIGQQTPNDPSDDVRLVCVIIDEGDDDTYNLESWGCPTGTYGGDGEHSASSGDNDPFTDWVYWYKPTDMTPGEAGYLAEVNAMNAGTFSLDFGQQEIFARTVLVSWNGGEAPPFAQDLPELGTIFRLRADGAEFVVDTFTFTTEFSIPITTGADGVAIYMQYDLFNKGHRTINDMFVTFWSDPDLGGASDDLVGCDTLNNIWFCYNATNNDNEYGALPPAVGFKLLQGPVVPWQGGTAEFFGASLSNYRNLPMTAFASYVGAAEPHNAGQTYMYMEGLDGFRGIPIPNGTKFIAPGDPVLGIGDLDYAPDDRRMMATTGPFDFLPGDSQQIIIKLAVGQGRDRLSSITDMKYILNSAPSGGCCEGTRGDFNGDGEDMDIADVTCLVDYLWGHGCHRPCIEEADINGDGTAGDIVDLVFMVDYLFGQGLDLVDCP